MKRIWYVFAGIALLLAGCSTFRQINLSQLRLAHDSLPLYAPEGAEQQAPRLLVKRDQYQAVAWQGSIYLFADAGTCAAFLAVGTLPPSVTTHAAAVGPLGEQVIAVSDANGEIVDDLLEKYQSQPQLLVRNNNDFFVWRLRDRLFVIGNYASSLEFEVHPELPFTKTLFAAGPRGETGVLEIDKKDNGLKERLLARFEEIAWPLAAHDDNYFVWQYRGQIYLLGDRATNHLFSRNRFSDCSKQVRNIENCFVEEELRNSRSYLNAGPHGETVVVEDDPRQPEMAARLVKEYFGEKNGSVLF